LNLRLQRALNRKPKYVLFAGRREMYFMEVPSRSKKVTLYKPRHFPPVRISFVPKFIIKFSPIISFHITIASKAKGKVVRAVIFN
jgi:hypothetical protein